MASYSFAILMTIGLVILVTCVVPGKADADHLNNEAKLIRHLTNTATYEKAARPVENASLPLYLNATFYLNSIVKLDDKEQELVLSGYMELSWFDQGLKWDPLQYEGLHKIAAQSDQIWIPDFGLFNSLDASFDYSSISTKVKMVATCNGVVTWYTGAIYRVGCSLDMTYFPFDDQECSLQFGSWSKDGYMMQFVSNWPHVDLDNYAVNGEWDIVSNHVEAETAFLDPEHSNSYWSTFYVNMNLKRKSGFYILNIIFPCASISLLVLMVFCVPSESGEKVSLGITVLLAFSVFQLVIAETMPKTSDSTPILVIYLSLLMAISAISTILSVGVLNLFHKDGDFDMPQSMQIIVFNYLSRLTRKREEAEEFIVPMKARKVEPARDLNNFCKHMNLNELGGSFIHTSSFESHGPPKKDDPVVQILQELLNEKREKRKRVEDDLKREIVRKKWMTASRIIDKFLMYIYMVTTAIITLVCLIIIPNIPRPLKEKH